MLKIIQSHDDLWDIKRIIGNRNIEIGCIMLTNDEVSFTPVSDGYNISIEEMGQILAKMKEIKGMAH